MLPRWTRDENILALWIATKRAGTGVSVRDPLIGSLSRLMRAAFPSAALDPRFRNRHGIARKIWTFMGAGSRGLSSIERAISLEFEDRPLDLIEAAGEAWSKLATAAVDRLEPSRGPAPSSCRTLIRSLEDAAAVYIALLRGAALPEGRILLKIGRSDNLDRREDELNFALPSPLGLRWRMIASWWFKDPVTAHCVEQAILQFEAKAGRSAGGEFLLVSSEDLRPLFDRCQSRTGARGTFNPRHWRRSPASGAVGEQLLELL